MYFDNEKKKSMSTAKLAVIGIVIIFVLIILLQNSNMVTFRFLFWKLSVSQILLLPATLIVGFGIGAVTVLLSTKKKQRE